MVYLSGTDRDFVANHGFSTEHVTAKNVHVATTSTRCSLVLKARRWNFLGGRHKTLVFTFPIRSTSVFVWNVRGHPQKNIVKFTLKHLTIGYRISMLDHKCNPYFICHWKNICTNMVFRKWNPRIEHRVTNEINFLWTFTSREPRLHIRPAINYSRFDFFRSPV